MKNQVKEVLLARPFGTHVAHFINNLATEHFPEQQGVMSLLIGSLANQTLIVSAVLSKHPPGSPEGLAMIDDLITSIGRDAKERWMLPDLKKVPR